MTRHARLLAILAVSASASASSACAEESTATPPAETQPGASDLRHMDRQILAQVQRPVTTLTKDIFPSASYLVTLQPDPMGTFGRVHIDLDRDRKPDEIWIVESPDRINRMVSTTDDGINYDRVYTLQNGVWGQAP